MSRIRKMKQQTHKESWRFLLCDISGSVSPRFPENLWFTSPLSCLEKAIDENPEFIILRFNDKSTKYHEMVLELAAILKRNSYTKACVILALLEAKHRQIMELLHVAGVDYVAFTDNEKLNYPSVRTLIESIGPDNELKTQIDFICPFLHYSDLSIDKEMTVCGAYLDRMVLGGRRLHELCETKDHRNCEYFQNLRPKS